MESNSLTNNLGHCQVQFSNLESFSILSSFYLLLYQSYSDHHPASSIQSSCNAPSFQFICPSKMYVPPHNLEFHIVDYYLSLEKISLIVEKQPILLILNNLRVGPFNFCTHRLDSLLHFFTYNIESLSLNFLFSFQPSSMFFLNIFFLSKMFTKSNLYKVPSTFYLTIASTKAPFVYLEFC